MKPGVRTQGHPAYVRVGGVDALLAMRLVANLATRDRSGTTHLVPMWFERVENYIHIPTSRIMQKYRNLVRHSFASVMIDVSRAGLDLRGVLIRGAVELVEGERARAFNRSIHARYVRPEGLVQPEVARHLSEGDDITIRISMDRLVTWNDAGSPAGVALVDRPTPSPPSWRRPPPASG